MSATTLLGTLSRTDRPQTMLRRFLALDAIVTGVNGLVYLIDSKPVGNLLGIGSGLLFELGVFLVPYAAGVGYLATRKQPPALAVKAVVGVNVLWAVLSVVAMLVRFSPTTAGAVWIPVQAMTVAGFGVLQFLSLRATRA
ncbi:hypothetical protein ACFYNZ_24855 [Streptomyces kebangsaanensis]|uniref:Integral membrane protein n=1 Tax=Streptomyces kebangsaanensis TaxID=864058 RepID=A0ABW6KXQ4_9ACTN